MALTLRFQPDFMDILPLYIVLLLTLPLFLIGWRSLRGWALIVPFAVWVLVQVDKDFALATYLDPETKWYFNPFAWQFLFLIGAALGWLRPEESRKLLGDRWLLVLAILVTIGCFLIRLNESYHLVSDSFSSPFSRYFWLTTSKTNMAAVRLINVLSVSLVVATLVKREIPLHTWRAAWPFIVCGRHSLHIFCLGILLSALGHWSLDAFYGGFVLQTLVVIFGIMIAVAAFMEWVPAGKPGGAKPDSRSSVAGGGEL
jgi:hypothetical protein